MTCKRKYLSIPSTKNIQSTNCIKSSEHPDIEAIKSKPFIPSTIKAKQGNGINVRKFMESLEVQSAKRVADTWEINSSNLTSFIRIDLLKVSSTAQYSRVGKGTLTSYARKMSSTSSGKNV